MGGIGDELALSELGALKRGQDRVEAHRESAEFVAALNWDPRSKILGRGETLCGGGQSPYRPQDKTRDSRAEYQSEG